MRALRLGSPARLVLQHLKVIEGWEHSHPRLALQPAVEVPLGVVTLHARKVIERLRPRPRLCLAKRPHLVHGQGALPHRLEVVLHQAHMACGRGRVGRGRGNREARHALPPRHCVHKMHKTMRQTRNSCTCAKGATCNAQHNMPIAKRNREA